MLTRRANRVRSLREAALSRPLLGPLPGDLVKLILRLLPLDTRLRAREVRRGWCALLEDAELWTHVDLSTSCGVNPRFLDSWRRGRALLPAAGARAKGGLLSVDLSGVGYIAGKPFVLRWLDSASAADKASLRDLVAPTTYCLGPAQVVALCSALPLCRVRCGVYCTAVETLPLLRREPPYELLSIVKLRFFQEDEDEQVLLDMASALSAYKGMEKLDISGVLLATRAVVDALLDATISAGIKYASFHHCGLSQIALPALGRLLQSPGFEGLIINSNDGVALFEGPLLPAFCEALHNSTSLKVIVLESVNLWADVAAATELIAALERHPALHGLWLSNNPTDGTPVMQQAAGGCLARLIARSSSLRVLNLLGNALGEIGMAPIFEALRGNSCLVQLTLYGEQISTVFARDVVLPAVSANTSLRILEGLHSVTGELLPELREVDAVLAARRQADEDAS